VARLDALEDARQPEPEALLPPRGIELADVAATGGGGVVVDDVEPAPALDRERHRPLEVGARADVDVAKSRGAAKVADLVRDALPARVVDIGEQDARPFGR